MVYSPSLSGAFYLDDETGIKDNPYLRSFSNIPAFFYDPSKFSTKEGNWPYRPLVLISFTIDYRIGKGSIETFHISNIVLHIFGSFLVLLLGFRLSGSLGFGLASSLLFAVHPLNNQAVCYLSSRSTLISFVFGLSSILFWLYSFDSTKHRVKFFLIHLFSLVLALGGKVDAAVVPFLLVGLCFSFFKGEERAKKLFFFLAPSFLVLIVFLSFYFYITGSLLSPIIPQMEPFYPRYRSVITQILSPFIYFAKAILPINLSFFPRPPQVFSFVNPIMILAITALITIVILWFIVKDNALLRLSIFWYFASLLPAVFLRLNILLAYHRVYWAMVACSFIFISFTFWVKNSSKMKKLSYLFFLIILIELSFFSHSRSNIWRKPIVLWREAVRTSPSEFVPYSYLGAEYLKFNDYLKATEYFERSVALEPNFVDALNSLGACYFFRGRYGLAEEYFARAVNLEPDNPVYLANLAKSELYQDKIDEFQNSYSRLLELAPYSPITIKLYREYLEFIKK